MYHVSEPGDRWAPGYTFTSAPLFIPPGGKKRWTPGQTFTTRPLFTFPKAKDKWAPGYIFMTIILSTFGDLHFNIRNNNRNRVDN